MEKLATAIYENVLDMDFMDYEENREENLNLLLEDLELLEKQGNGTLLESIKMLVED